MTAGGAVEKFFVQLRAENPRRDRVDANALRPPLDCERPGERDDRRFARAVGGHLVKRDERRERSHVDDPTVPVLDHMASEYLAAAERARQVGLQYIVPIPFAEVESRTALGFACAVDENIHLSERGDGGGEEALERAAVGDVRRQAKRPPPEALHLFGGSLHGLEPAARGDDVGPGLGESQGEGAPDPGRTTEDDGDAPVQVRACHGRSFPALSMDARPEAKARRSLIERPAIGRSTCMLRAYTSPRTSITVGPAVEW